MIELVQIAIGTRETLSRAWTADDWRRAYKEARRQALVGVCWQGVENDARSTIPEELAGRWFADAMTITDRNAQLRKRQEELLTMLHADGFACRVLKGQAVAEHYPRPELRQCGDLDLWTAPSAKCKVPSAKCERQRVMEYFRSKGYAIGEVVWHHADVQIFKDVEVEIHFVPSWLYNPIHNRRLLRLCSGGPEAQDGLTEATYLLLHIYRHLFHEGVGMRHLLDYYLVTRNGLTDEDRRQMKLLGISRLAEAADWACCELFDPTRPAPKVGERRGRHLLDEVLRTGDFGGKAPAGGRWTRLLVWHRQTMRWMRDYPQEALWELPWRLWHFCWRFLYRAM